MNDLIRREDAIKALYKYSFVSKDVIEKEINAIPSADRPQGDSVSRQYLLAEIDDLADEFSEVDENGLHSERWCGIIDAKCVIANAPLVADRPQGEWIRTGRTNIYGGIEVQCSNCGDKVMVQHLEDEWYCRHCGADMGMKGADDDTD